MIKKIVLLILCIFAFSLITQANETIKNDKISVEFVVTNDFVGIKQITDLETYTNFLKNPTWGFWTIDATIGDKKTQITTNSAKDDFQVENLGDKIIFTWKNIRSEEMESGFDVVATITLKDENSYWDIEVGKNDKYGIEKVGYPLLSGIDAQDGDEFLFPQRGGRIYTNFSDPKGFKVIRPAGVEYSKDIGFYAPGSMQLFSHTKKGDKDVSLYLCPEDTDGNVKTLNATLIKPNNILFAPRHFSAEPGVVGKGFKLAHPVNFAVVQGDWYNVAKKYRKWGIEKNFSVFANGKIEDRNDLPDWFKKNNVWFKYDGGFAPSRETILESQAYLDMPAIVHAYTYSQYDFDTHYPNWVPVRERTKGDFADFHAHNMHVMPYTNGHLVDINLSPAYKEYGDILLQKKENGENYYEPWAVDLGANNNSACIESPYYDVFLNEAKNILNATDFDSLYVDQVGGMAVYPCYNKEHHHTSSDYIIKTYNKLIKELREQLSEMKGEGVPITTEDCSEIYLFDAWLRINDGDPDLMDNPANMAIYSDYVVNFGQYFIAHDEKDKRDLSSKIKIAMNLTKGYQMGWSVGQNREWTEDPFFGEYFKRACKAREAFTEYFNFGEYVRPVKYDCGKVHSYYWFHNANDACQDTRDFKTVWTCSFNYKGKTMICFTSIGEKKEKITWECLAKDLNLDKTKSHTIKQVYAKEKTLNKTFRNAGNKALIKSTFEIDPFDIVVFIVE